MLRREAILLLGPTGSGKTPLGEWIEREGLWGRPCVHFDFGAHLRRLVARARPDEIVSPSDLDFLKAVLRSGALLENEHFPIAERVLRSFLAENDPAAFRVVVLNGLPRHVGQAEAIDAILAVGAVIALECSAQTVLERIAANAGGDRGGRPDDDPESVRRKLRIYHERTSPLIAHYRGRGARIERLAVTAAMTAAHLRQRLERKRGHH